MQYLQAHYDASLPTIKNLSQCKGFQAVKKSIVKGHSRRAKYHMLNINGIHLSQRELSAIFGISLATIPAAIRKLKIEVGGLIPLRLFPKLKIKYLGVKKYTHFTKCSDENLYKVRVFIQEQCNKHPIKK